MNKILQIVGPNAGRKEPISRKEAPAMPIIKERNVNQSELGVECMELLKTVPKLIFYAL